MGMRSGKARGPYTGGVVAAPTTGLTGTLTNNTFPVATGAHTLGDSLLTWDGVHTLTSAYTNNIFNGIVNVLGDFEVNGGTFYVHATTGNALFMGTLDVAGDLWINSGTIKLTAIGGNIQLDGYIYAGGTGNVKSRFGAGFTVEGGLNNAAGIITYDSNDGLHLRGKNAASYCFSIDNDGGTSILNVPNGTTTGLWRHDFSIGGNCTIGDVTPDATLFTMNGYRTTFDGLSVNATTKIYVLDNGLQKSLRVHYTAGGVDYYGCVPFAKAGQMGKLLQTNNYVTTATYAALTTDGLIQVDTATPASNVTVTMPLASDMAGTIICIKKVAGAFNVIVVPQGPDVIDLYGASFSFGTLGQCIWLQADGTTNTWNLL